VKRFVYIPSDMAKNEESIQFASKISHDSRLSIRIGSPEDGVKKTEVGIVSFPEKSFFSCDKTVKAGFVCALDITNEFVVFNKDTSATVFNAKGFVSEFKPVLLENHLARFRFRLALVGIYNYSVTHNNEVIYFGDIEVV
jgi:hypothetical protein